MQIGYKLRLLRKQKGITLKRIAEETGFSTSFISQVERELVNPSVASLKKICDVFNVPLSTFFDEDKFEEITCDTVVRKNNRRVIQIDGSRSVMALLNSDLNHKMEMILITAEPGAESGDVPHRHDGEECGIVIKGKMEIILDDKSYILDEGDSFYFSSERAHRWRNIGDGEMVSVWAITPPSF